MKPEQKKYENSIVALPVVTFFFLVAANPLWKKIVT